ncbi:hypothetical protein SAMN05444487_11419 [Marininema mesophilum]|uniref:Uncharacterized protein n=1 Tax=Marininema mesophilum TaxID=1048340 RepID=A0A1H3AQM4_9BACL|nr:hypothetical protein [Marininema mesophilum]SDX31986.1 hypothetical protein SAMN05444487_11419 [Marininema mesophilum]
MLQFAIPNRPFASEPITGLMTPDGIFEVSLGKQIINIHLINSGIAVNQVQVYIESISDPGIVITAHTHDIAYADSEVSHLFSWEADFSAAAPGKHMVSFIVVTASGHQRIIKKIFVTKMNFNPSNLSFSVTTPEAVFDVAFKEMIGPQDITCSNKKIDIACYSDRKPLLDVLNVVGELQSCDCQSNNLLNYLCKGVRVTNNPHFSLCARQLLIGKIKAQVQPTPAYKGQYGDLPFQDPWWKVVLAIVAFVLLVAAAIAEAVDGSGDLTAGGGGTHDLPSNSGGECCTPAAQNGGDSKIAAGLVAAAATVATIAGASDARDPFRKGQDHTAPATGTELTLAETLDLSFSYPEEIVPGKAFKVKADWQYQRDTTEGIYEHKDTETNANIHILSSYDINAPNTVHPDEPFIIKAQFYNANNNLFVGNQLFVQCFFVGPSGEWRSIVLQDNGLAKDEEANDGTYTGVGYFSTDEPMGRWKYLVVAQDVNHATPDMKPEDAAQIVGGMLLTNQLSFTFGGGDCPINFDGEVNVG